MKEYLPEDIRNIALVSHQTVGKTSLAEAILYSAGGSNRLGNVDDGTTSSDYNTDEIERKISIATSVLHCIWNDKKINVIDVPGYADFFGEVKSGLRVADLAVILINAVAGIEVGTDAVWDILEENNTPRMFFVNRQDKEHAKFDNALSFLREAYGNKVTAMQFPVNEGEEFDSIIDLLQMKKITFNKDNNGKFSVSDIPGDLAGKAEELREQLIEKVAESDDEVLESYFENGELTPEEFAKGLSKGIADGNIYPVLCGAATKNMGTHQLLDLVTTFGPSPLTFSPIIGRKPDSIEEIELDVNQTAPLSALIFKTVSERHVGELSLVRVYSGTLSSGNEVANTVQGSTEKIGQIYLLNGKNRNEVGNLKAGDIGALVKLKSSHTGDTLCGKKNPVVLPEIEFPTPLLGIAVTPKSKGDEEKISTGLATLHEVDPSFVVEIDPELHQTVVSGQGELHLAIIMNRLKERFGVDVEQKKPKIPYRETITAKASEKYRHKKQTGGAGQFAEVWMRIEPKPQGEGFEFENKVVGGSISSVFIPSVEKGVRQVLTEGALAGYTIVDVKATVYDGKEHPVDSKDIAFQIAGREVFKMAILNAKPILLEPIYDVEIKVPEDFMGDVMGDLSSRRGKILGMDSAGRFQLIKAQVPLAELYKYSTTLRSLTQGRASHRQKLSHYQPLPKELVSKVIDEAAAEKEK